MGKVNAATVASNCGKSFPGIKLALVVGICGVVPFGLTNDEIVLGDVIISNGVIQYDFGRQLPGHFVRKDTLSDVPGRPNLEIRGVLAKLKALRHRRQLSAKIADYLDVLRQDRDLHAEYPGSTEDRLFEASYRHTDYQKSCEQLGCNGGLVSRTRLQIAEVSPLPAVHFGLMASGDAVMKSGEDRDRIAAAEGIIAFEMEGAGVWDSFPCIIIKGACDYADSHKSKAWQRYAAATAAACAKAFLSFWVPSSTQAITQAAAYMNENQIPLTEYLQLFENTDRDRIELLSAEFQDDTRYEQTQDPVATTWFISFNQIRRANELASRILMFLAYVEPKAVPQSMLPEGESQQQLTQAIGTLCGYRFLDRRESSEIFDIHSLVHLATRSWVAENESGKEQRQAAIARLRQIFPTDDWENREVWRQYLPHAIKLLRCPEDSWNDERCELGYWVGRCLHVDGRVTEAVELLEHVVQIQETTLAEDHPSRLASQHALAGVYEANGQIKEAVKLLENVVQIQETTLAEDHPSRLASQHALAGVYEANGQIKEAVKLLENVVQIQETTLAEDHPDRLVSQHELAGAYKANGQIKEAVKLLEHVVAVEGTTLAEDHPSRLASQHALAGAYKANGQIAEAVKLLEHVVAIQETTLAEDHPDRLASQHALAGVYEANGQIKEAVKLLEHVVQIQTEIWAEDDYRWQLSQDLLQHCYERLEGVSSTVESEASDLDE
ncbi:uncharacterized protein QYS62_001837 [Fusarium acuminatum]|uniref:Nucleoside phosphorylase domain-containing protein n=1 Tax=Fusarium acuminatum TaxID=5515 RepID=A0ABZ2WJV6_9HYPO